VLGQKLGETYTCACSTGQIGKQFVMTRAYNPHPRDHPSSSRALDAAFAQLLHSSAARSAPSSLYKTLSPLHREGPSTAQLSRKNTMAMNMRLTRRDEEGQRCRSGCRSRRRGGRTRPGTSSASWRSRASHRLERDGVGRLDVAPPLLQQQDAIAVVCCAASLSCCSV
jgi:hypothetical protein